jgi:formamidopyrimidine-DNA glycosylase
MEFPEIKRITRQLNDVLRGKRFIDITLNDQNDDLIKWGFVNLHKHDIVGLTIEEVTQRGIYCIVRFEQNENLVFGDLIGKLLYHPNKSRLPNKYTTLFSLSDKSFLSLHVESYGYAYALNNEELNKHKYFGNQGLTAWDESFSYGYFEEVLNKYPRFHVKKLQQIHASISGFQNGYMQDIFLCAGILPYRKISRLTDAEKGKLYKCMVGIISEAVEMDGSTDEVDIFGHPGRYRRMIGLRIKNRICPRCGDIFVSRKILGTPSYFCMSCQH